MAITDSPFSGRSKSKLSTRTRDLRITSQFPRTLAKLRQNLIEQRNFNKNSGKNEENRDKPIWIWYIHATTLGFIYDMVIKLRQNNSVQFNFRNKRKRKRREKSDPETKVRENEERKSKVRKENCYLWREGENPNKGQGS